ncbi:MAG: DUF3800 domain-containing protein [Opitutales bacterium]|nr:DUF3800 domain-containing protein [Opitutales bacterium]
MSEPQEFSVYCDESCHLENDLSPVMTLGSIHLPNDGVRQFSLQIREIKRQFGLADKFEIKWTKVSPSKLDFYLSVLDYFFSHPTAHFRAVVLKDKGRLDHKAFDQTHDSFYYKFYYLLLKEAFRDTGQYRVFLDIKDTTGWEKAKGLETYLYPKLKPEQSIKKVEIVRSDQIAVLQVVDLLIGALTYHHRGLSTSAAKSALVDYIKNRTGLKLLSSTKPGRSKFDHFIWEPDFLRNGF